MKQYICLREKDRRLVRGLKAVLESKRIMSWMIAPVITIIIWTSCSPKAEVLPPSEKPQLSLREQYSNLLSGDSTILLASRQVWLDSGDKALDDSVYIKTPYHEQVRHTDEAVGLRLRCVIGQQLSIVTDVSTLLIDIWRADSSDYRDLVYAPDKLTDTMIVNIDATGDYLLRLQSKIGDTSTSSITVFTGPQNIMPVVGADNEDVWSRFGDPREGGRRVHEGVDVFKRRGTIIVSAAEGTVRTVKNEGLGGKQVWIRDARLPISHYYAHLDSQYVTEGQVVMRGDTLGTVGNTGNARTTRPHLHYGMYTRQGAIDPFPFIGTPKRIRKFRKKPLPLPAEVLTDLSWRLRIQPSGRSHILMEGETGARLTILGWTNGWWHVETAQGLRGFVYDESYLIASL